MPPKTILKFFFYDRGNVMYDCIVDCKQCEATAKNGNRCKIKTCFSLPFCHIHLPKEYGVKVKQSTIPQAGKGLFATKEFKVNELICPLWGNEKSIQQHDQEYGNNNTAPYSVQLNRNTIIDGSCKRYVGHNANTKLNADGSSSLQRSNAKISINRRSTYKINLKATKTIKEGDEIFVYYGNEYQIPENYEYKRVKNPRVGRR
jgi:hypothetical protein